MRNGSSPSLSGWQAGDSPPEEIAASRREIQRTRTQREFYIRTGRGVPARFASAADERWWLLYGSRRNGVRQLFVRKLTDGSEQQLTENKPGEGSMWGHWRPAK